MPAGHRPPERAFDLPDVPIFIRVQRRRRNPHASRGVMQEHKRMGEKDAAQCDDFAGEEIDGDGCVHVGVDEFSPNAVQLFLPFTRRRLHAILRQDGFNGKSRDGNFEFLQLANDAE
jgi:hypothetical protein